MRQPKVSIIVPIYNVEKYLSANLDSIFGAKLEDKEILLVNDGTTDNSFVIAEEYYKKFPDNVTLLTKTNGGLSSARNYGLERAKGEYVMFFDSDDLVHPEAIDIMTAAADSSHADIVVADYYEFYDTNLRKKIRPDKALITTPLITEEQRLLPLFPINVSFAVWNKMYRRSFIKKNELFFLEGYWFEDLDFIFKAFYKAAKIIKVPEILYGYRQRDGSIMKSISPKILDKIKIMDQLADFLRKEGKFEKYKNKYDVLYLKMAFSILYVCVRQKKNKSDTSGIVDEIFKGLYFKGLISKSGLDTHDLSTKEQVMYFLTKFRLINRHTLKLASYFWL